MTRAMATHHGGEGIRVNCIAPGIDADGLYPWHERRKARGQSLRFLLKTEGSGWEVVHVVHYLGRDAARWVTGVAFPVEAGTTAGRPGVYSLNDIHGVFRESVLEMHPHPCSILRYTEVSYVTLNGNL